MHSYTVKFLIRKDVKRKDGTHPIYLQCFINKERYRVPIGYSCKFSEFKVKTQRVRLRDKTLEAETNNYIESLENKIKDIFLTARMKHELLTKASFLKLLLSRPVTTPNYIEYINYQIEESKGLVAHGTILQYVRTLNVLKEFDSKKHLDEIDYQFVLDLEKFMKQKKLATNSRWTIHKNLKKFLNSAVKRGDLSENIAYQHFKMVKAKTTRDSLEFHEVNKLHEYYLANPSESLRIWLGMAYTSLRIQDILEIEYPQIKNGVLIFTPKKTKEIKGDLRIPLSKRALQIFFPPGRVCRGNVFDSCTPQVINKQIKKYAKSLDIKTYVTCHVARHTFATLFLRAGGKLERLQEIMGHSSIETTMIYTHVSLKDRKESIRKMNDMFDGLIHQYASDAIIT